MSSELKLNQEGNCDVSCAGSSWRKNSSLSVVALKDPEDETLAGLFPDAPLSYGSVMDWLAVQSGTLRPVTAPVRPFLPAVIINLYYRLRQMLIIPWCCFWTLNSQTIINHTFFVRRGTRCPIQKQFIMLINTSRRAARYFPFLPVPLSSAGRLKCSSRIRSGIHVGELEDSLTSWLFCDVIDSTNDFFNGSFPSLLWNSSSFLETCHQHGRRLDLSWVSGTVSWFC